MIRAIICQVCGKPTPRTAGSQKYCAECRKLKVRERGAKWQREFGAPHDPVAYKEFNARKKSAILAAGENFSAEAASSIADVWRPVELAWLIRIAVPFEWSASKNHMFTLGGLQRRLSLREEVRSYQEMVGWRIKQALGERKLKNNKLWVDIFVQKINHKGDAVNFVDVICDAIKKVVDLDDRWFSLRRVDWEVVKTNPRIFIGIGQEDVEDCSICSSCGRLLPFAKFDSHKGNRFNLSRNCRECRHEGRRRRAA